MCPPDRDERRNRSPTIFIFEGSDGEGTDAHPLWGPRARFWAGRADGPSQRSTHLLVPSKTKVAAERCRSGAEVWTCPPDRNQRRNRSPTIFIFEGSDGEGTDAHPLWGPRARFWAGRADGPSQRSSRPLAPSKTKVAAERCRSGAEVWTCPPDRNERRNRSPTIFIFEGSDGEGTDARPLWGPRARFWAGRADGPSQGSTRPLAPSKTKVAAERCRSGAEVWTCPPDWDERRNRSPTIFIFEGSDGEGTDAHPLWGPRARFWAGRADGPSQWSTNLLAPSKTKVAAERCRSGAEVWTCPPDRNERRNRSPTIFIFEGSDGEGTDARPLWGPRARFWAGRADGPSQRSTQPLAPSKTKVAAERCRSGAEVWTCPPDRNERRNRSPTIFIFEGSDGEGTDARPLWGPRARFWAGRADGPSQRSTQPLAPSKTKVAAERCRSGAEVWTCPPDWDERRNRSPTIFIFEGSDGEGTDAHPLWGPRARFWAGRADGPSQRSTQPLAPSKTKVAAERCRSGAEVWTCPPDRNERRNRSPTIFIFEGSDGEGTDARPLWGPRARFWAGRADGPSQRSTRPLAPSKTKVAAERCRSGAEVWTCPPDRDERRNRSPTIFIFEGTSGGVERREKGNAAALPRKVHEGPRTEERQALLCHLPPSKTEVAAECCRHLPR